MQVSPTAPQNKTNFAQLRSRLGAAIAGKMPASFDYVVATLNTDTRNRRPETNLDPRCLADMARR